MVGVVGGVCWKIWVGFVLMVLGCRIDAGCSLVQRCWCIAVIAEEKRVERGRNVARVNVRT